MTSSAADLKEVKLSFVALFVLLFTESAAMGNTISTDEPWVQTIFQQLSPRLAEFASETLSGQVEPLVQKVFEKSSSIPNVNFKFTKMDFGTIPPKFGNLTTHQTPAGQELAKSVIVDFDFSYLGNSDLQVSMLRVSSGIRDLQMSGKARIVMKPTTKQVPFVGGLQFSFLEIPKISFNVDGIADILDWPPIKRKVLEELEEDMAKRCVYPNSYKMPLSDGVDIEAVKAFEPTGLLVVKLVSADNLAKKGGLKGSLRAIVGQNKPDPYAKIRLGANMFESKVINDDQNPDWNQEFFFLLDVPKGHKITLDFYDKDTASRDNFLGHVQYDIDALIYNQTSKVKLDLKDDKQKNDGKHPTEVSGSANIELQFLPLKPSGQVEKPRFYVVSIFIYSFNNVIQNMESSTYPSSRVTVQAGTQVKTSTNVKKDTPHPNFEESFTFLMTSLEDIVIKITDDNIGHSFGSVSLNAKEILTAPIKRKIVAVQNGSNPFVTATISASIKTS